MSVIITLSKNGHELEFIDPKTIAKTLQVSMPTVYAMAQRGELSAIRVGQCYRFIRSEFEEWIKKQIGDVNFSYTLDDGVDTQEEL